MVFLRILVGPPGLDILNGILMTINCELKNMNFMMYAKKCSHNIAATSAYMMRMSH